MDTHDNRQVLPKASGLMSLAEKPLNLKSQLAWKQWLADNHSMSSGVWLELRKKGSGIPRVTYAEALNVALCYGWIDAKKMSGDDQFFLQRFVPRAKKSIWSKVNREHVVRLSDSGEMNSAGIAEVERAKNDGRWDAAYDSQRTATVPADLGAALNENAEAKAFFATLKGADRYAILFRLHNTNKPQMRERKIDEFVRMLEEGRTFH